MLRMNFTVDQGARFSDPPSKPLTTTDLVRKIRQSLIAEDRQENAPKREAGLKERYNHAAFSRWALERPYHPQGAVTVAKQYRYRGVRISLSKSEAGTWTAAWSLFVNKEQNCIKSGQLISESPCYDAEILAASHAMCAIDQALKA